MRLETREERQLLQEAGKATILVVDDELSIRISLGDLLRRDGYQVEVAESGESALETLKTHSFGATSAGVAW